MRSLFLLVAALVIAVLTITPVASAWKFERQRTFAPGAGGPEITQADRAAFDPVSGELWLLQQFDGADDYTASGDVLRYNRTDYSIRLVRVAPTLATWSLTEPVSATSRGQYAQGSGAPYEYFMLTGLLPGGMAVDGARKRVYVAAGNRILRYSYGAGDVGWQEFVGPNDPGAGWFGRDLVPGAITVDQETGEVYVADAGAVQPVYSVGAPDPAPSGSPAIQVFRPTGEHARTLTMCPGAPGPDCLFGEYAPGSTGTGTAITSLGLAGGRLTVFGVRVETDDAPLLGQLATIDPLTGDVHDATAVTTGIGTRPLGGPNGVLDIAQLPDGDVLAPGFGPDEDAVPGRLMELDAATGTVARFTLTRGATRAQCRFVSPHLRLAAQPLTGDTRVAIVEDAPFDGARTYVRFLLRAEGETGCPETAPRTPEAPELDLDLEPAEAVVPPGAPAVSLPGGPVAEGARLVMTQTREVRGSAVDPDNDGAPLGAWSDCRVLYPNGTASIIPVPVCDASQGGDIAEIDPELITRPAPFSFVVRDDDGDRSRRNFSVVRGTLGAGGAVVPEPLAPDATVDADATLTAQFGLGGSRGNIETWELAFGDGETATGTWEDIGDTRSHTYAEPGDYTATLTLRTPSGETAETTRAFRVGTEARLAARLAVTSGPAVVNQPVTFSLDGSEGTSWSLDFGDDRPAAEGADAATAGAVTHVYGATGSYRAQLTVRRGSRAETASVVLTVGLGAAITRVVVPSCTTPLGVPLGELGLGDPALCTADPCDIDVQELGLTKLPIARPAGCSGVDDVPVEAAAAPPRAGARPQLTRRALTLGRDGRIAVQVRCAAGAGLCAGTVRLETLAAKGRPATGLGSATFRSLPVGRRLTVHVRPSAANARRLRKAARTRVRARLTPRTPASGISRPAGDTATMTLTAGAARGR